MCRLPRNSSSFASCLPFSVFSLSESIWNLAISLQMLPISKWHLGNPNECPPLQVQLDSHPDHTWETWSSDRGGGFAQGRYTRRLSAQRNHVFRSVLKVPAAPPAARLGDPPGESGTHPVITPQVNQHTNATLKLRSERGPNKAGREQDRDRDRDRQWQRRSRMARAGVGGVVHLYLGHRHGSVQPRGAAVARPDIGRHEYYASLFVFQMYVS